MKIENWPLEKLVPYQNNARTHSSEQVEQVAKSIREFGFTNPILVDGSDGIIAGHCRLMAARKIGLETVPVIVLDHLSPVQVRALIIADNQLAISGSGWDENLLQIELNSLKLDDFDLDLIGFTAEQLDGYLNFGEEEEPVGDETDDIPEPAPDPVSRLGDVWVMGGHRIMCGDSTDGGAVAVLMGREKAVLCHADPPYGMGKEKDGVQNDNIYMDKLDSFQMAWWKTFRPYLADNASAYIWGNPEDLWRLWYVGGMKDSERLTFRNEIVWDKGAAGAGGISHMGLDGLRLYPNGTERCLFFMLGEQGFNNNADNYWHGWDGVLGYLQSEAKKCGLTSSKLKQICGVGMYTHWFTESQWAFIPEQYYLALQREYDGFKLEYDGLKREFYSTRAHFDNTHENMTDVWQYSRVQGEDRHGHATPKPVDMISRALKSSCPEGDLVIEPFSGSGTTIIAAEKTTRRCFAMELSPNYVDVAVKRWQNLTHKQAVLEGDGRSFDQVSGERCPV